MLQVYSDQAKPGYIENFCYALTTLLPCLNNVQSKSSEMLTCTQKFQAVNNIYFVSKKNIHTPRRVLKMRYGDQGSVIIGAVSLYWNQSTEENLKRSLKLIVVETNCKRKLSQRKEKSPGVIEINVLQGIHSSPRASLIN